MTGHYNVNVIVVDILPKRKYFSIVMVSLRTHPATPATLAALPPNTILYFEPEDPEDEVIYLAYL